ncbi:MAG TPA: 3'(2'),5'-bisphosphate nucleotidase CysQ [Beijerinckiaceae bacterium]|nr:3'(2'),5'-bisphosphate nucleotidase CysQ [Beijerinckiaceae bacterium]
MMATASPTPYLGLMRRAAQAASEAALRHFRAGSNTTARVSWKEGGSPVTEADHDADAAIRAVLSASAPDVPVFSEEAAHELQRLHSRRVFVVDPIDGTRAFMQGRDEWCVSIAMMEDGRPVAGVVHAPARNETFEASSGSGAFLNGARLPIIAGQQDRPIRTAGPRPLIERIVAADPELSASEPLRALAYRLVAVASGGITAALASKGAHDWDIAAADVILAETGCVLLSASGERPVYNAPDPVHPALVAAPPALVERLLALLERMPA